MVDTCRPVTSQERSLLTWLIEHCPRYTKTLLAQLESVEARSSCSCGCPSIQFRLPSERPAVSSLQEILADFIGTSGQYTVGLILFARAGVLSELEVYSFDGNEGSFGLPAIESPKSWHEASQAN
jgi:hypothetical protein